MELQIGKSLVFHSASAAASRLEACRRFTL